MRLLLIGNLSDRRCGFANFTDQNIIAFRRAGHTVTAFDGTYSSVYARQQTGDPGFLPSDAGSYDVIHLIWHAMTMNHYTGCVWPKGPVLSFWDGGPSNAYCPFHTAFSSKWTCYDRSAEGYHENWYPIPDWVTDLPTPAETFTVGVSSVRGDGVAELTDLCAKRGWGLNVPTPGQWLTLEDEVRRLAKSTVNVSWYETAPLWKDRAGAPSMALASGRPLLISRDSLLSHLWDYPDIYHGRITKHGGPGLEESLERIKADYEAGTLLMPSKVHELDWAKSVDLYVSKWGVR